jgi:high-affinity nickel-transport protein
LINALSILVLGFCLGVRHAADPDHVIAVTTIVSHQRRGARAALTGFAWGLGHTLTIVAVGIPIIVFNMVIPPRVGMGMELAVALMLIVLGLINQAEFIRPFLRRSLASGEASEIVHSHAHSHGDYVHSHPHGHNPEAHSHRPDQTPLARLDRAFGRAEIYRLMRPFVVGVVHGLAGSAAATLLVLAIIPQPTWAVWYLILFGAGTIAGMMLITISLASAFRRATSRHHAWTARLKVASGLVSLVFGLVLAYQIVSL